MKQLYRDVLRQKCNLERQTLKNAHCHVSNTYLYNNKTFFLTPRTHILKSKGTEVPFKRLLPSTYYIGEKWYNILPFDTSAVQPAEIKPMTKPTWEYINPAELATNGIYSDKEPDQIRESIMFPVERSVELNDIAREMMGYSPPKKEGSLLKLLN